MIKNPHELSKNMEKANTTDELIRVANENGVELTGTAAEAFFTRKASNELTDDELKTVAGGIQVERFKCKHCGCSDVYVLGSTPMGVQVRCKTCNTMYNISSIL